MPASWTSSPATAPRPGLELARARCSPARRRQCWRSPAAACGGCCRDARSRSAATPPTRRRRPHRPRPRHARPFRRRRRPPRRRRPLPARRRRRPSRRATTPTRDGARHRCPAPRRPARHRGRAARRRRPPRPPSNAMLAQAATMLSEAQGLLQTGAEADGLAKIAALRASFGGTPPAREGALLAARTHQQAQALRRRRGRVDRRRARRRRPEEISEGLIQAADGAARQRSTDGDGVARRTLGEILDRYPASVRALRALQMKMSIEDRMKLKEPDARAERRRSGLAPHAAQGRARRRHRAGRRVRAVAARPANTAIAGSTSSPPRPSPISARASPRRATTRGSPPPSCSRSSSRTRRAPARPTARCRPRRRATKRAQKKLTSD